MLSKEVIRVLLGHYAEACRHYAESKALGLADVDTICAVTLEVRRIALECGIPGDVLIETYRSAMATAAENFPGVK